MVTREALRRGSLKFQRRTVSQPGDEMPFQEPQPSDQMPVQMPQPSDQMPVQMQQEFLTASTVLPLSYLLLRSCWKLLGSILNLPDKNTRDRNSLAFNTHETHSETTFGQIKLHFVLFLKMYLFLLNVYT